MSISRAFEGLHSDLSERVLGVFFAVYNELGEGFMEKVYRRAMLSALREAGLSAEEEVPLAVYFRGREVGLYYADLVVDGRLILELKATDTISKQHLAQLGHYLRSTDMEVGYVLAFGANPNHQRVLLTNERKRNLLKP